MSKDVMNERRRAFLGASAVMLSGAVMAGRVSTASSSTQAEAGPEKTPAVIGYPNAKGVKIERVTYPARNLGTSIVANLFLPAYGHRLAEPLFTLARGGPVAPLRSCGSFARAHSLTILTGIASPNRSSRSLAGARTSRFAPRARV